MKKIIPLLIIANIILWSCYEPSRVNTDNPFFSEYNTPFKVPPFDKIRNEHFFPTFEEGIKQQQTEINAIINSPEDPSFKNTILALERSGALLTNVSNVFYNLNSAHTNDTLQTIAKEVAPILAKHEDDINLNEKLFLRVKEVFEERDQLNLTTEQHTLLEKYYKEFVRGGANLNPDDKETLRSINEELSVLSLSFGENILEEDNAFELIIDKKEDLVGLPPGAISAAAEAAQERGHEGKWVFTLHKPSMLPFLKNSPKRELRERIFKAYINRGNNNNELDNKEILAKIVTLRVKKAKLLGYQTHAHFILEKNMAQKPEKVYEFLDQLWKPALLRAQKEAQKLQKMIYSEGADFKLQPWDWWYYAEKLKKAKYDLDEEMLRPYFKLENVINGAFDVANKLYGIQFVEQKDIPKYHEDVKVFEVKDSDGTHLGILYTDYFPRANKRGGAWKSAYRKQSIIDDKRITPVICNVGNLSKPTADKPSLLTSKEVETLFHEFGHALHGLLSNSSYPTLSGTAVPRDFVELPSQIMENWAFEEEVLKMYARHYETGDVIPKTLIDKIIKTRQFNQGFATVELLAASYLDMDWHTLQEVSKLDVLEFDKKSMNRIGLIPEIVVRYRSPYFRHIFTGGYSAGYYSYIWAEVLDADAFEAFKETNLFDKKTAQTFRNNILATGGTEDPMVLYKKFRGAEPKIDPLLKRRGLN